MAGNDKTVTTIDTLSRLLITENFNVITASKKSNKFLRLLDMLFHIIKYKKWADFVLIDTYSTQNFYYAYLCSQLCRFFKVKYIPILHGGELPKRLGNSSKLSKAIFNNAYKNIAPTEYLKSKFEAFNYSNLEVIHNSIEIKNYHFKKRKIDKVKLLWVRSFSKIYNPELAIKVLKALKNENIEAELCMVGPYKDGSLLKSKRLAKALNVEVNFTGKLEKEEWVKLSEQYNIFINTTNFDNMPVSVIEAMALGLPVVSTNVGGMPYLIENRKDGVLVEPNNTQEFINAIKEVVNKHDYANNLVMAARKKVEKFNWEIVKHQWINLLQ